MAIKPITDTLRLLQSGLFIDKCSDSLAEVVKSVDETGKPGKLTITLDLKKSGGAIEIAGKVTNKAPEPKADSDLLWPTVEGNLSINNPNQRQLDLRQVETPKTPARPVIDEETGEIRQA
jgi:hypothetical protein